MYGGGCHRDGRGVTRKEGVRTGRGERKREGEGKPSEGKKKGGGGRGRYIYEGGERIRVGIDIGAVGLILEGVVAEVTLEKDVACMEVKGGRNTVR